jgi:uncharacterized membrane protein YdjX (TVP38/TMEM64 family)
VASRGRWLSGFILAAVLAAGLWSYFGGGFVSLAAARGLDGHEKVRLIQAYFAGWGPAAPLVYIAIVIAEVVVAPIPGTMLYLPGGLIFGWKVGGVTSLIGNTIGAGLCCLIARSFGRPYVERFFPADQLARYDAILGRHALWVIILLRGNPLTSADLVSYAAGLTSVAIWRVMLGTMIGMAPLCFAQAYFAEALFTQFPALLYPLAIVGVVYVAYAAWVISRFRTTSV